MALEVRRRRGGRCTSSPAEVTSSRAATDVARLPLRSPEPCVAVATAPATEMCGSEARLASATPSRGQLGRQRAVADAARHGDGAARAVDADLRRQRVEQHQLLGVGDRRERVARAEHADALARGGQLAHLLDAAGPVQDPCAVGVVARPVLLHSRDDIAARR